MRSVAALGGEIAINHDGMGRDWVEIIPYDRQIVGRVLGWIGY